MSGVGPALAGLIGALYAAGAAATAQDKPAEAGAEPAKPAGIVPLLDY